MELQAGRGSVYSIQVATSDSLLFAVLDCCELINFIVLRVDMLTPLRHSVIIVLAHMSTARRHFLTPLRGYVPQKQHRMEGKSSPTRDKISCHPQFISSSN